MLVNGKTVSLVQQKLDKQALEEKNSEESKFEEDRGDHKEYLNMSFIDKRVEIIKDSMQEVDHFKSE